MKQIKIAKTYIYDPETVALIKVKAEKLDISESAVARYLMKKGMERDNEAK